MADTKIIQHNTSFTDDSTAGTGKNINEIVKKLLGDKINDHDITKQSGYFKGDIIYRNGKFYRLKKDYIKPGDPFVQDQWQELTTPADIYSVLTYGANVTVEKAKDSDRLGGELAEKYAKAEDISEIKNIGLVDKTNPLFESASISHLSVINKIKNIRNCQIKGGATENHHVEFNVPSGVGSKTNSAAIKLDISEYKNKINNRALELRFQIPSGEMAVELDCGGKPYKHVSTKGGATHVNGIYKIEHTPQPSVTKTICELLVYLEPDCESVEIYAYNTDGATAGSNIDLTNIQLYDIGLSANKDRTIRTYRNKYNIPIVNIPNISKDVDLAAFQYTGAECNSYHSILITQLVRRDSFFIITTDPNLLIKKTPDALTEYDNILDISPYKEFIFSSPHNIISSNHSASITNKSSINNAKFGIKIDSPTFTSMIQANNMDILMMFTLVSRDDFNITIDEKYIEVFDFWVDKKLLKVNDSLTIPQKMTAMDIYITISNQNENFFKKIDLNIEPAFNITDIFRINFSKNDQVVYPINVDLFNSVGDIRDHFHTTIGRDLYIGSDHTISANGTSNDSIKFKDLNLVAKDFKYQNGKSITDQAIEKIQNPLTYCANLNDDSSNSIMMPRVQYINKDTLNIPLNLLPISNSQKIQGGYLKTIRIDGKQYSETVVGQFIQELIVIVEHSSAPHTLVRQFVAVFNPPNNMQVQYYNWFKTNIFDSKGVYVKHIHGYDYQIDDSAKLYLNTDSNETTSYAGNRNDVVFRGKDNKLHTIQEVFQSAVDGKQALINEINTALGSDSGLTTSSTWEEMINKFKKTAGGVTGSSKIFFNYTYNIQKNNITFVNYLSNLRYTDRWKKTLFSPTDIVTTNEEIIRLSPYFNTNGSGYITIKIYVDDVLIPAMELIDNMYIFRYIFSSSNDALVSYSRLYNRIQPTMSHDDNEIMLYFAIGGVHDNINYYIVNKYKKKISIKWDSGTSELGLSLRGIYIHEVYKQ